MLGVEIWGGTLDRGCENIGATNAKHVSETTNTEQVCPSHDRDETILEMWDGMNVGDATQELEGDAKGCDGPDKPVWAVMAEDAIDMVGLDMKWLRRLWCI